MTEKILPRCDFYGLRIGQQSFLNRAMFMRKINTFWSKDSFFGIILPGEGRKFILTLVILEHKTFYIYRLFLACDIVNKRLKLYLNGS